MILTTAFLALTSAANPSLEFKHAKSTVLLESTGANNLNLQCSGSTGDLCAVTNDVKSLKTSVANINNDLNKIKDDIKKLQNAPAPAPGPAPVVTCPTPFQNMVKNGGFSGMTSWVADSTNWGSSGGGYGGPSNHAGGLHIHGSCQTSYGGVKQTITGLKKGSVYNLQYQGWGGDWDGTDNDVHRGIHDTDSVMVIIDGNRWIDSDMGTSTSGAGAGISTGQNFFHSFVATGTTTDLVFWAGRSNCFDIDNVQLTCGGPAPVVKKTCASPKKNLLENADFSQGMNAWTADRMNYIGSGGGYGGPSNHAGGLHLHGSCQTSWGGIKQYVPNLQAGVEYTLSFDGWGGSWDGDNNDVGRGRHDADTVWVHADRDQFTNVEVGTSTAGAGAGRANGKRFTHTFLASGDKSAVISFWAARSNCFDIDNVKLSCGEAKAVAPVVAKCSKNGQNVLINGDFSQSMTGWMADSQNWIGSGGSYGGPSNHAGGLHLHGSCQTSYGGAKQFVPHLEKGVTYTLTYDGYGGSWDGDNNDVGRGRHDADTVWINVDGNQFSDTEMGTTTQGAGAGLQNGQRFSHTFVATGAKDAFLSFWSARSNCFDIDNVQLRCGAPALPSPKKCISPGRNVIYNPSFSQSMTGWMADTQNWMGSGGSFGGPSNHAGGLHIHGSCQVNYGGVKQFIPNLQKGVTYTLKFDGWGGNWDGDDNDANRGRQDTDTLWTHIDGNQFSDGEVGQTTQGAGAGLQNGKTFTHTFTATGSGATFVSFWAARSNCFDIDNVQLYC